MDAAVDQLLAASDPEWGGLGGAPKFPQPMAQEVLAAAASRGDARALAALTTSLDAMAAGGIYDHLGGGFARYAVDAVWLVPHFEKMLYDNALLIRLYLHGWQLTGAERFRQVLTETIDYVLRDLRQPGGGTSSAEDADSEGVEGKFYVWSEAEVRELLGADADAALHWYGFRPGGNFEHDTTIPNRMHARGELARPTEVETARAALFAARARRVRPGLDDKVLTEWNAYLVAALAEAGAAAGEPTWVAAAVETAEFLIANLRREDGRWLRAWQADAGARHLAYATDHGALVDAFTRLAEATGEARWIGEARSAADALLDLFWDDEHGGVFTTGDDAEVLITRPKDLMDNATPGANGLAAVGLLRLAALTGDDRYREHGEAIVRLLGPLAVRQPSAFGHVIAADRPGGARHHGDRRRGRPSRPARRRTSPSAPPRRADVGRTLGEPAVGGPGRRSGLRLPELRVPAPRGGRRHPRGPAHARRHIGRRRRIQSASSGSTICRRSSSSRTR